jgi:hypothetical protein
VGARDLRASEPRRTFALGLSVFVDIAQVIAMFAALTAVWYAEQTVVETRALRREERVARLFDLIADVGNAGMGFAHGHAGVLLDVPRLRLRAALSATGEALPKCEQLLDAEWPRYIEDPRAEEHEAEARAAVDAALQEVSVLLARLRDAPKIPSTAGH